MRRVPDMDERECAYLADEMKKSGAKGSGCLLLQAPLWVLVMLVALVCLIMCLAANTEAVPHVAPMLLFSFLIPIGVNNARKWVWRMYYKRPIVIGGASVR
jgi:hypothetical protein